MFARRPTSLPKNTFSGLYNSFLCFLSLCVTRQATQSNTKTQPIRRRRRPKKKYKKISEIKTKRNKVNYIWQRQNKKTRPEHRNEEKKKFKESHKRDMDNNIMTHSKSDFSVKLFNTHIHSAKTWVKKTKNILFMAFC